ncbi:MAG: DNA topoisomerase I [Candidatus Aenigmarchaeota archaeon]|nr:DNA topoisomerase I [Candidatus Aenigmarchaeota archaeon]
MSYTLIITEKPNAADRIAHALAEGSVQKLSKYGADYYKFKRKGKEIVVAPAVGHLFVLNEQSSNKHWTYPIFSVEWKPTFTEKNNTWSKKYYQNIQELAKHASEFISACDYDIEGSVIAANIIKFICKANDGKRMKFSTLTDGDIVEAYEHASPHLDFPQIEAGLARHQLDWYFGINLSRALTLALEHVGGYWTLSTGRVQGPTLSILEQRQKEIKAFRPMPYWEIELDGKIDEKDITASHIKDKFWKKDEAESVLHRCKGKDGVIEDVEKKLRKENPPFPFDLTTLQRESYNLFGYSPKQTLDIAQGLYEHALISYPRTSSQKLPAKIGWKSILAKLGENPEYSELSKKVLSKPSLKPNEGPKEDSAHPSIFPTGHKPKKLSQYQKKIYDFIVKRFFAVFGDPAVREQVRVIIRIDKEQFVAHGITTVKPGWMELYRPYSRAKEQILPDLTKGEKVSVQRMEMLDKQTEPPSRYTQASILKEMETLGLGTKATRAQILQTLYDRSYIKDPSIVVTELGEAVVNALEKHCPEIISVDLTKKFEQEMEQIEEGKKKRGEIISKAEKELERILADFKKHETDIGKHILSAVKEFEKEEHTVGKCECGGELHIIHSKKSGKRFVGCTRYPKCKKAYPVPQRGFIHVIDKKCFCGLGIVEVRNKGRRPWRLCCAHGFNTTEKKFKEAKANPPKPYVSKTAKPEKEPKAKPALPSKKTKAKVSKAAPTPTEK